MSSAECSHSVLASIFQADVAGVQCCLCLVTVCMLTVKIICTHFFSLLCDIVCCHMPPTLTYWFSKENFSVHLLFILFHDTLVCVVDTLPRGRRNIPLPRSTDRYHDCWCFGDTRGQSISSDGISDWRCVGLMWSYLLWDEFHRSESMLVKYFKIYLYVRK